MKNITKIFATTILAMSMAFVGCNKEQNNEQNNEPEEPTISGIPVVVTSEVTEITNVSAVCGGVVTSDGGYSIVERGICYGTEQNPLVSGSHLISEGGLGSFTVNLTGLEPNTTYFLKAYAINSAGIAYGSEVSFTTQQVDSRLPVVTMVDMVEVTAVSANVNAMIEDEGNGAVFQKGFCWSEQNPPTIDDFCCAVIGHPNTFSANLTNLQPNTSYYVRAYAINGFGVGYSSVLGFTTLEAVAPPVVSVLGEEGYLYDGQIVDENVEYTFGFNLESFSGLSFLRITIGDEIFDEKHFSGETSYIYENSVVFTVAKEIIGDCTFTAVVIDVHNQSSSASFTVYINQQEQPLLSTPFEWVRTGAAEGVGLEEFGLSWRQNSKDIFARIKPLDGVTLMVFDSSVWDEVTTDIQKAVLFAESGLAVTEYANVSVLDSNNYNDVIGTILPDGTMRLIHVTNSVVTTFKGLRIDISGEWK